MSSQTNFESTLLEIHGEKAFAAAKDEDNHYSLNELPKALSKYLPNVEEIKRRLTSL